MKTSTKEKLQEIPVILALLLIVAIPVTLLVNNISGGKLLSFFSACRYSQYAVSESINVKSAYRAFSDTRGMFAELDVEPVSGDIFIVDIYPGNTETEADRLINVLNQDVSLRNNVQMIYVPDSVNSFLGRPRNVLDIVLSNGQRFDFCK